MAIGLASRGPNGQLIYHPRETNTYVILVTDNGSTGTVVKVPVRYQPREIHGLPDRSMGSRDRLGSGSKPAGPRSGGHGQYSGPLSAVRRNRRHRCARSVPRTRRFRVHAAVPEEPAQPSIRKTNYTQIGTNLHANGEINGPCQYNATTCTQIAPTKGVCEDNNGIWWGAGATDPSTAGIPAEGLTLCCDVAVWQADHGQTISSNIYPLEAYAIRNNRYKLVINDYQSYDATANACAATSSTEFYRSTKTSPFPKLDTADADLLASGNKLNRGTAEELRRT